MRSLFLTSFGIHAPLGYGLVEKYLKEEKLEKKKILLITLPEYEIDLKLIKACVNMGFQEQFVTVFQEEKRQEIEEVCFDYIYVSEGNTFEILEYIRQNQLVSLIRKNIKNGADYIGASAGAHIAGMDIEAAIPFDRNRLAVTDFEGLGLFNGVAIPHYDASDVRRFLSYKTARDSGKYQVVYTIGNEEILKISS